jgi:hypothetical protein
MMRTGVLGMAAAAVLAIGLAGTAEASTPAPTTIAKSGTSAPVIYVDGKGTTNVVWTANNSSGYQYTHYARKAPGAKRFTEVSLPGMPSTSGAPFIWSPSNGALEVIVTVNGPITLAAWRSSDDGASWTKLPATPLTASWGAGGLYLLSSQMFQSPGGPLDYAGSTGYTGPIVQLNADLTAAPTVATATSGLNIQQLGANAGGTVFMLGAAADSYTAPGTLPFQAGASTGQVTFPCGGTAAVAGTSSAMAVGRSSAVVAFAGCGHVWARTVSPAGAVGPLVSLGGSPGANANGFGRNGTAWVGVSAAPSGAFTAAWTVPGEDVQVGRSGDGAHWKTSSRLVPAIEPGQSLYAKPSLALGAGGWLGLDPQLSGESSRLEAIALSSSYAPPKSPSARGIAAPRRGRLASLAVVAPGRISHKSFDKTGKVTLELVDALGGKFTISVGASRVAGTITTDLCSDSLTVRLKPGRARTVTMPCSAGGFVFGGGAVSRLPSTRKGDTVAFSATGRSGSIVLDAKVS